MNVVGIGAPEIAIIIVVMFPVIAFAMLYRRMGENNRERRRLSARANEPRSDPDVRRDDV